MNAIYLAFPLLFFTYTDIKHKKIPNTLLLLFYFSFIILSILGVLDKDLKETLLHQVIIFAFLLIIWLFGSLIKLPILGAGDVKLMTLFGFFLEPRTSLLIFFSSILVSYFYNVITKKNKKINLQGNLKLFCLYGLPLEAETKNLQRTPLVPGLLITYLIFNLWEVL